MFTQSTVSIIRYLLIATKSSIKLFMDMFRLWQLLVRKRERLTSLFVYLFL